jgi:hypothetical protein
MADDRRNVLAGDSFPLTINPAANAMGFAGAQSILRAANCPTGKSANLLSSPLCKNISVSVPPNHLCRVIPVYSLLLMCVLLLQMHTRLRVQRAPGIPHALQGGER